MSNKYLRNAAFYKFMVKIQPLLQFSKVYLQIVIDLIGVSDITSFVSKDKLNFDFFV